MHNLMLMRRRKEGVQVPKPAGESEKERRTQQASERTRKERTTKRATAITSANETNAACTSTQDNQRHVHGQQSDKAKTTQLECRRTHRGNKTGARVATTQANRLLRDGPHTWRSLYCTASLLIQTISHIKNLLDSCGM